MVEPRPFRIGIDARIYGPAGTGVGRYVQNLVENLQTIDSKNQYVIFLGKEGCALFHPRRPNFQKRLVEVPWYGITEQLHLPSIFGRERLDLLHVPHFNAPLFYRGKLLLTIHDLTMLKMGERETSTRALPVYLLKRLGLRSLFPLALKKAAAILVPSQFVKQDLASTFGIYPEKISVTYEAGELGTGSGEDRVAERLGVPDPYFVYVGSFYPHKNVGRLLEAIKILNRRRGVSVSLVLVRAKDQFAKVMEARARDLGVSRSVFLPGHLEDSALVGLLRGAQAYVQPSLLEGFGLGPLEAMTLGTPVVCARSSSLPEVGGEAVLYFDPLDPSDLAAKLAQVVDDAGLRHNLSRLGKEQARKFSWVKMAQETLAVYQKILS